MKTSLSTNLLLATWTGLGVIFLAQGKYIEFILCMIYIRLVGLQMTVAR